MFVCMCLSVQMHRYRRQRCAHTLVSGGSIQGLIGGSSAALMYWQKPGQVFWGSLGCASYQAMALVPHFAPGGLLEHGVLGRPVDGDLWGSGAARRLCLRKIQVLVGSQEDHPPPPTHTHRGWGPGAEEELGGSPSPPNHTHTEGGVQVLVRSREDTPRPDTHTHTRGVGSRC